MDGQQRRDEPVLPGDQSDERRHLRRQRCTDCDVHPTAWTFGGIGLKLVGQKGHTTIKEEIDLGATAPYTVHGNTIHLGPGSYKLIHVSTTLTTNGKTASVRLPNTHVATPGNDVGYNCTPRVLHLEVAAGASSVTLTLARSR